MKLSMSCSVGVSWITYVGEIVCASPSHPWSDGQSVSEWRHDGECYRPWAGARAGGGSGGRTYLRSGHGQACCRNGRQTSALRPASALQTPPVTHEPRHQGRTEGENKDVGKYFTAWSWTWPVYAQCPAHSQGLHPADIQCLEPCLVLREMSQYLTEEMHLKQDTKLSAVSPEDCNTVNDSLVAGTFWKHCKCLPHRGMGALFPLRLCVIIWSSTSSPSKTHPSFKVNFPYEPYSTATFTICVYRRCCVSERRRRERGYLHANLFYVIHCSTAPQCCLRKSTEF